MKRITFLIASMLAMLVSLGQQGYPTTISTPTAFNHLRIDSILTVPTGSTPSLNSNNLTTRAGALFLVVTSTDTLLKLWTGERWIDIAGSQQTNILPNELIFGGSVTPLGGYDFHIQEAIFRIDNVVYQSDAQDVTITGSDGSLSRIDRIFLMANTSPPPSGIADVLEGELAVNPLEPQLDGDQIGLAFISIPAGATSPTLVSTYVYQENIGESTVTNVGTTTDPNNLTNVYAGTKALNVTNINNNDQILFTKPTGVWSVLGFDGLSMFIKLKAIMPGAGNLRVQLFVGTTAVSSEVLIPINKSNITTYQPITIPAGSFGNITNTSITRVRIRYTRPGNNTVYSGFYLDDMFFIEGISQPSTAVTLTFIPPVGFQNSPGNTINNNGTWTMTQIGGVPGQYYGTTGWSDFPELLRYLGDIDGRARVDDGATVDGDTLFLQTVNGDFPGLATPDMYNRSLLNYYIQNGGNGDTLAYPINDSITGIKSILVTGGLTISTTDTTVTIDGSGLSTPNLQTVTNVGFITDDPLQSEIGFDVTPAYTSDFVSALSVIGNGTNAMGQILLREWSPGDGKLMYLQPVEDIGAADVTLYLHANNVQDTVALLSDITTAIAAIPPGGASGIDDVLAIGQVFTTDREIDMASNTLYVHGNNATAGTYFANTGAGFALSAFASGAGTGALITSASGYAIQSHNFSATLPVEYIEKENNRQAIIKPMIDLVSHTFNNVDSVAAPGFGTSIETHLENNNEELVLASRFVTKWTDVTDGSEDSEVEIWGMVNGVETLFTTINASGAGTPFTTEDAQDAVGAMVNASLTYTDGTPLLTIADRDNGDITTSGAGLTWTIDAGVISLAKQADVATSTVFYRKTAGTGAPEVQTLATLKTDLGLTGTNSGDQTITLTSDVTGTGAGSFATTIAANAVTFAKMQAITDNRLLGAQGGTAVEEIALTANDFDLASNTLSIDYTNGQAASGSAKGFLISADWTTFNNKQSVLTNSAGLAAALSDEVGTGNVLFSSAVSITKGFMSDVLTANSVSTIIPRYIWYDEFQGSQTNTIGSTFMFELVSGTGANASSVVSAASIAGATGYGYAEIITGTTNSGKAILSGGHGLTNNSQMGKVDNDYYYRVSFKNVIFNDLSDGSDTYKTWMGFGIDNANTNGIWFTYSHSENSGVFNCVSYNNTTAETTSTATTVAADTEYDLDIEFYNQTAKFYINGSLVATHSTQVPAAAGTMQAPIFKILKSAGTNARQVFVDAVGLRITHENDL